MQLAESLFAMWRLIRRFNICAFWMRGIVSTCAEESEAAVLSDKVPFAASPFGKDAAIATSGTTCGKRIDYSHIYSHWVAQK